MNEEEVKKAIAEALKDFSTTFMQSVTKVVTDAITPIQQTVTTLQNQPTPTPTPTPTTSESDPKSTTVKATVAALQTELANMKKESEEKDKKAREANFKSYITDKLSTIKGLRTPQTLRDLFISKWGSLAVLNDDNQWILGNDANAKLLDSEIKAFFETDEGKNLISVTVPKPTDLKPTNTTTTPTNSNGSNGSNEQTSLDLFGDYVTQLHAAKN